MGGKLDERVFEGPVGVLSRLVQRLRAEGICARLTRPRRKDGVLCVSQADGERARALIVAAAPAAGGIVSAAEAAWFRCDECGASLSEGADRCGRCGARVGDPHGR